MPGVCLSLIEGPQRLVIGLLRAFQAPNSRMRLLTSTRHMFLSVQDAPKRSFPLYHCSAVKLDAAAPTVPDAEQAVKMVPEISVNLLKFGCDISELDGDERNGALANVKAHLGEGMPRLSDVSTRASPSPPPNPCITGKRSLAKAPSKGPLASSYWFPVRPQPLRVLAING